MNVVFMGTPEFACIPLTTLAGSHHKILAVVTGPDKPAGRGHKSVPGPVKQTALALGFPIHQPESLRDETFIAAMASLSADLFVVIAFRILPPTLFTLPRRGSINIHASLLPRYRGAAPIHHALLNGETETGLTSFFLAQRVDEGAMIHQTAVPVGPDETFTELSRRLSHLAGPFLLETLDMITRPGFAPRHQDDRQACPAPKIHPDDGLIDWRKPRHEVHNHIRAYAERPGAFGFLGGRKIKILRSEIPSTPAARDLLPGEIEIKDKQIYVGAGDGPIRLVRLQPEGKRPMDGASFINGYRLNAGDIFDAVRKEVRS